MSTDDQSREPADRLKPMFAMLCCANGAEAIVKQEIADLGWRPAFSRPGFVTCKHDTATELPTGVFVRTSSKSIGVVKAPRLDEKTDQEAIPASHAATQSSLVESSRVTPPIDADSMIEQLLDLLGSEPAGSPFTLQPLRHLHVWPRDRLPIGRFGFEPGIDPLCEAIAERIARRLERRLGAVRPQDQRLRELLADCQVNQIAEAHQQVLDVVVVEPDQWFVGCHQAGRWPSRWPGGVQPIDPAEEPISRAYFKAAEAISWSGFDLQPGDLAVEVGSAPGGACGRLLEMGLRVLAIDPAEMDRRVASHPNLTHLVARAGDLPRKTYRGAKWLLVDSNVKPDATLSTVENLVKSKQTAFVGLLITLKLGEYHRASQIPRWHRRMTEWGATSVEFRQLARNRLEVCAAVTMPPGR